jgi:hypothetical protein
MPNSLVFVGPDAEHPEGQTVDVLTQAVQAINPDALATAQSNAANARAGGGVAVVSVQKSPTPEPGVASPPLAI